MNSGLIPNWRSGGERASYTASFADISYCDTITTQIHNWSQRLEFAKMWNDPKNCRFGADWFFDWVQSHQEKNILFGRNGCIGVDALRQSRQRHPSGGVLCAQLQYNSSRCISPSYCCLTTSSRSVGFLFKTITLALWPTGTIGRDGFIRYALASGFQCDGWHCENLSSRSFCLRGKCNSLLANYTHHSKSLDLWGYWQSIAHSVRLLPYY